MLTGRSRTADAEAWAPHYLIMGVPPTPAQAERLLALARTRHRTALGFVIAGDVPRRDLDLGPSPTTGGCGPTCSASTWRRSCCRPAQYAAVVGCSATAAATRRLTPPRPATAPRRRTCAPGARMPVEIGLLGPARVQAPGPLEPDRLALATELVVYLAAHPDGVHPNVLAGAVWPRGVSPEVRDAALARVHAWLGTDDAGQANLVTDPDGRLRLGPSVRVDWQVFRALFAQASQAAGRPHRRRGRLPGAGAEPGPRPVAGRARPGRYAWLATDELQYEVTALVADAAHRLSALRLARATRTGAMDGGAGRAAAGVQRRDALARPADRRARHRPGARAARRGRRDLGPGRAG